MRCPFRDMFICEYQLWEETFTSSDQRECETSSSHRLAWNLYTFEKKNINWNFWGIDKRKVQNGWKFHSEIGAHFGNLKCWIDIVLVIVGISGWSHEKALVTDKAILHSVGRFLLLLENRIFWNINASQSSILKLHFWTVNRTILSVSKSQWNLATTENWSALSCAKSVNIKVRSNLFIQKTDFTWVNVTNKFEQITRM